MEIIKYRSVNKGTLVGKLDLKIPKWGNFIIRDITFFQQDNKKWITFPSQQFEVEGQKKYKSYNLFEEASTMKLFQAQVLKALDEYFKKNNDGDSNQLLF